MKVFIGGAWPYANNSMHVGHLAALLPGDVIARYYGKKGDEVIYVSGTDCHGTPITERAKKEGINPNDIAMTYHNEFEKCFNDLNFSYDLYGKTTEQYHKDGVKKFFLQIMDNGYIHSQTDKQDFCPECNEFLSDREIEGTCPYCGGQAKGDQCDSCLTTLNAKELLDKHCKTCGSKTIEKDNTHLIFELSKFQDEIQQLVDSSKDKWRLQAISESIKYLNNGLIDRVATRQLTWGVDTPVEGFEDKKIYVWIEAVLGYLTAGRKAAEEKGIDFDEFMKNSDDLRTYYVHGKDNIPFHTIIFPALLLALKKDIKLPEYIVSSQYVNINDEKIAKSKNNGVTVKSLVSDYDADTIRYYMTANGPERADVNFSYDVMEINHNKHLVGEYGNFVNRNLAFLVKKFDGIIPNGDMNNDIKDMIDKTYILVGQQIERGNIKSALNSVFELVQFANKYYDEQQPWIQVKENMNAFNDTTYVCINLMANIANMLEPFMPKSSMKVKAMLGVEGKDWSQIVVEPNRKLENVDILFNRIETKELKEKHSKGR